MADDQIDAKLRPKPQCYKSVTIFGRTTLPANAPDRKVRISHFTALQFYLLLPLASALIYATAAICLKIALGRGVTTWVILFWSNMVMGLFFVPLLFWPSKAWDPAGLGMAAAGSLLFFTGQIATFRSLQSGDVSIATPALASKVIFVALLCLLLPDNKPGPNLWIAVALTVGGVVLLHRGPRHSASRPLPTLAWALSAAFSFAAADVFIQIGAPKVGFSLFLPVMFGGVAALSLPLLWPHVLNRPRNPPRRGAWIWTAAGVILLGVQATSLAASISIFGDATGINVVYGSRGLWSLLLLAVVAQHLGVADSVLDRRTLGLRVIGSVLILAAVAIALVS